MSSGAAQRATAVVVGASSGIGRACCVEFASRGLAVAALARSRPRLDALAAEVDARDGRLLPLGCDVTDSSELLAALDAVGTTLPAVAVVVHCAGSVQPIGPIWECDYDIGAAAFATMVTSAWVTTAWSLRLMVEQQFGVVLLASSGAADKLAVGRATYSSSKAAVNQLVKVAGAEIERSAAPVAVAGFYPGMVATPMHEETRRASERYAGSVIGPELAAFAALPAGDLLRPALVAAKLAHLATLDPGDLNGRIWRLRADEWVVER